MKVPTDLRLLIDLEGHLGRQVRGYAMSYAEEKFAVSKWFYRTRWARAKELKKRLTKELEEIRHGLEEQAKQRS